MLVIHDRHCKEPSYNTLSTSVKVKGCLKSQYVCRQYVLVFCNIYMIYVPAQMHNNYNIL